MLKTIAVKCIEIYQKTLSPDHGLMRKFFPGGYCKFTPTCSDYAKEAILKYGFFKGVFKGVRRVFKCNPCSKGGLDLP